MVRRASRLLKSGLRALESDAPGQALEDRLAALKKGPLRDDAFPSRLHCERNATTLGMALAVTFLTCFATGLYSHFIQHPLDVGFLSQPTSPGWLYRFTQGLHVASGIAAIPLLLAKLWTVYPRLFAFPPLESAAHAIERASLPLLVGGSVFMLFTGLANTARWYPWDFFFVSTHFWTAWITIGALVAHIGAKWTIARRELTREARSAPEPAGTGLSRRGLLFAVSSAVAGVTLTTVGQTLRPLKELAALAPRKPDVGPQGIPVNRSAQGARVLDLIRAPEYRLVVNGNVERPLSLTVDELRAIPRHEAELPITCVEGWSAGAVWRGVRVRDLLDRAGAPADAEVVVRSLQPRGAYRSSQLNANQARHENTLLALEVGGEELHADHGFPCRLIAPNRPGVQQTKWVTRLEVV